MDPMEPDNLRFHLGPGLIVANLYPLLYAKGFYDGMREEGETEIIILVRRAWVGSQRYGAAVWSGDVGSTFEALSDQVRAGLNMGMSGIPGGQLISADSLVVIRRTSFRELMVRWFQFGVFCPLFRSMDSASQGSGSHPARRPERGVVVWRESLWHPQGIPFLT